MQLVRSHLRALALQPVPASPRPLSFLAAHLLALTAVCRLAHWPLWTAPMLLAAFCLPLLLLRRWFIESLAPLFALYALAMFRLYIVYGLRQVVPAALDYTWALAISAVWAGLIFLQASHGLRYVWVMLAAAVTLLMLYVLYFNRPAGVTGSDPFAYVQMALDLVQHGTPRHLFPLAPLAVSLALPILPTVHVGYVLPDAQGVAPTVWPPGYSLLLALAYRLGGEGGMLSLNLWIGLSSLILTLALTTLICPGRWRYLPLFIGMGALTVVATSPEQFTRLVTPLADGAAQALTTSVIVFTFYSLRFTHSSRALTLGVATGLALAAAFSVRYTQVLVGPGIALIAWFGPRATQSVKSRRAFLSAFALAALIGAVPDAWYRTRLYGAPWRFGTGELTLFSVHALSEAFTRLRVELFSPFEFGVLWPLLILGALYLWQRNRFALLGLGVTYGPLIFFHLWYPFVRLRDVLSIYPPLAALCALGGAVVVMTSWRGGTAVRLGTLLGLFVLCFWRLSPIWGLNEGGFFTFGYLRPEQRQAFETLTTLTEPEAVIACSLNSGAVELYGRRVTVRPGNILQPGLGWDDAQWLRFVAALREARRPLYLLMDSPEMDDPLAALRRPYALTHVADLDVPVYYLGGGSLNLTVPLYRVEP